MFLAIKFGRAVDRWTDPLAIKFVTGGYGVALAIEFARGRGYGVVLAIKFAAVRGYGVALAIKFAAVRGYGVVLAIKFAPACG